MRGRKPKPTILHKLEGTFNVTDHRNRALEPVAAGDLHYEPPAWMTIDQRAVWIYATEHAPKSLLKMIDRGALTVWVIAEDQHRLASEMQAKIDAGTALPLLTKDKSGMAVVSPYVGIINRAGLRMLRAATELGFSPAARPRLVADTPPPVDASPWAKLEVINGGRHG
jgi:P27 family predicted phage terminase small subunit